MPAEVAARERQTKYRLAPPAPYLKWLEFRVILEAAALVPAAPYLLSQPRGDGHRVVVVPGFLFGPRSTAVLRSYLRYLGYDAVDWGFGVNQGQPERDGERLADELHREPEQARFSLVGWSLGGVISRVVAAALPDRTRQVITMGTPVEGGPKYTVAADRFAERNNIDLDAFEAHVHARNREGVDAPITAIYSKGDGVVGWRSAIDRYNAHAKHRRVWGSHVGLGLNPLVLRAVAQALASH